MEQSKLKTFEVPIEWIIHDTIKTEAETLEEAIQFVLENINNIAMKYEPKNVYATHKFDGSISDKPTKENIASIAAHINKQQL